MTTFILIRHGNCDAVGNYLAGRMSGIHLNKEGKTQAEAVGKRMEQIFIDVICSSPLERAIETSDSIANYQNAEIVVSDRITDIDYGEWTGKTFKELSGNPLWQIYNTSRENTRIPGGEIILEVQERMATELEAWRTRVPDGIVAMVSHCDTIKTAIGYYTGMPLDKTMALCIDPATISVISVSDYGVQVGCVNHNGANIPM